LTMNNSTLYQNQTNLFPRAVYIALMGDPTLRMEPIAPRSDLNATADDSGVHLSWIGSGEDNTGYYVYRSTSANGPFVRISDSLLAQPEYNDVTATPGTYTYMVRAVALQTNFSGSYFDPSQGILATLTVAPSIAPLRVQITAATNQITLSWNSQAGASYRVQAAQDLEQNAWEAITAPVIATGTNTSWSESFSNAFLYKLYRIVSP
jgi:hypothetical protein